MDAEDLFLREFLGVADAAITRAAANWIRSQQRDDGTWASFHGGPPELSTTVEAYWALKLAGDPAGDAAHAPRRGVHRRRRRARAHARVHTHLDGALRLVVVVRAAGVATRGDAAAATAGRTVGSAQHLRLRLLGPPDGRPAHRGRLLPAGAADGRHARRAAHRRHAPGDRTATRAARPRGASSSSIASCGATSVTRSARCVASPGRGPSAGSSSARRPTAAGAASSHRGSTR